MSASCPPWCRTTAEEHALDGPGELMHSAAPFRGFVAAQIGDRAPTVCIDDRELSADQVRQRAAELLELADWMVALGARQAEEARR